MKGKTKSAQSQPNKQCQRLIVLKTELNAIRNEIATQEGEMVNGATQIKSFGKDLAIATKLNKQFHERSYQIKATVVIAKWDNR